MKPLIANSLIASLVLVAATGVAEANPRPLPFSYPYETLGQNQFEVEQYADLVPVRVARENPDGTLDGVMGLRAVLQTELEFGVTDRLELGFYFAFSQDAAAGSAALRFDGVKQRGRLRLAEQGEWPVDVGLYLELTEFQDELEIEEKILLAKRFGNLNVLVNLWVEHEWYYQIGKTELVFNPTAGAAYQISPKFLVGVEYWGRGEFGEEESSAARAEEEEEGMHHFVGPTFLAQSGKVFFSAGAYLRLDELDEPLRAGDSFGHVWIRTVLGVEL